MERACSERFREQVERGLDAVGGEPDEEAFDGILDAASAAAAVRALAHGERDAVLLRVMPALPDREGDFAPRPVDPRWLRVERGGGVRVAPLRGPEAGSGDAPRRTPRALRFDAIEVEVPGAKTPVRALARLSLSLGDDVELVVAERLGPSVALAKSGVSALARELGELFALEASGTASLAAESRSSGREPSAGESQGDAAASAPIDGGRRAKQLARFSLRFEGDVAVLRDHDSAGPREGVRRNFGLALGFSIAALPLWALVVREVSRGSVGGALGFGAVAAVLTLAAYAFAGVARFAAKYQASSKPLMWVGADRFVVAPWVDREGAVDRRPEGRLGAAISLRELHGASVQLRDGAFAIELATEHGPIDAMSGLDEAGAAFWCHVLDRALKDAADPLVPAKRRVKRAA